MSCIYGIERLLCWLIARTFLGVSILLLPARRKLEGNLLANEKRLLLRHSFDGWGIHQIPLLEQYMIKTRTACFQYVVLSFSFECLCQTNSFALSFIKAKVKDIWIDSFFSLLQWNENKLTCTTSLVRAFLQITTVLMETALNGWLTIATRIKKINLQLIQSTYHVPKHFIPRISMYAV